MKRFAAVLAAAFAVAASPAAADECAAHYVPGGGGVVVHRVKTDTIEWCSSDVMAANADVHQRPYTLRAGGSSSTETVQTGLSVSGLLDLAGLPTANVDFTRVDRPVDGSWATLDGDELDGSGFAPSGPPVFEVTDNSALYLRQPRNADDDNARDFIHPTDYGSALDLYVYSGPLLTVTAHAGATEVAVGDPVSFSAGATGGNAPYRYDWDFRDGAHGSGSEPTHAFTTSGTYRVRVTVRGDDDSAGTDTVLVKVGKPPPAQAALSPTPGGGTSADPSAPETGPQNTAGTQPGGLPGAPTPTATAGPATAPGPARATVTPEPARAHRRRHRHQQVAKPAAPAASAAPSRGADPAPTRTGPHRRRTTTPPPGPSVALLHGRLLTGATPVPASAIATARRTPAPPAPAARAPGAPGALGAVGLGAAIVMLLGAGAGTETLRRRPSPALS